MEKIITYFIEEKKTTAVVAKVLTKIIMKYEDLQNEFLEWIDTRSFDFDEPVTIEGYTAKQVHEIEPTLDAAGIYNFMVTLREEPDIAKGYIKNGFPRK
ncbi:MAG: hypothetical protein GX675_06935 [Erysipelotrichaceae bacterium]|nr:hypothetical protein [Erysipelotrichaceae bacterium]